jgi:hypothetical protein
LYRTITARESVSDEASLANTEREIREFLDRYPRDPRAAEISRYHEQIELDKAERRLQREARSGGFVPTQHAAERLYLQAMHTATTEPGLALSMFQSIVDLYANDGDANIGGNGDGQKHTKQAVSKVNQPERASLIVQLSKRRIVSLQKDIAKEREAQLADIHERLEMAAKLTPGEPNKAAAMLRAIVHLYEHEPWARDVVAEARNRLEKTENAE